MCLILRVSEKCRFSFQVLFALLSLTVFTRAGELTGNANLSWNLNPETNIAGYRVLYGTASGKLNQSQPVYGNISTATVSGLETGKTYYFAVSAYNSAGLEGPPSDEVVFYVAVPTAPEISIERSPSVTLVPVQNNTFLGEVKTGNTSAATEFVIRNTGTATLTDLTMEIDGVDHPDFAVTTDLPFTPILTANAAFEANFSAWTTSGNLRITRDATSPGGGNVADFNFSNTTANGSISQNFATTPGKTYTLTFDVGILSFNFNPQSVRVTATGAKTVFSETVSITGAGDSSTYWEPRLFTFVADSYSTQLMLSDVSVITDGADLRIDNVRVIDTARAMILPAPLTLEPGESSTFNVTFSPSSGRGKTAYIHVLSNDADKSPFDLTISGTGVDETKPITAPEIEIRRAAGTNLVNGSAIVSFDDALIASFAETEILTITNAGTANLAGLSVSMGGANPNEFATDPLAVGMLAPGESTAFQIRFKPTSAGIKNALLQISSNDEDEPTFKIALTGNGATPTPAPTPEISVERATGSNLNNRESISFGDTLLGASSVTENLTIQNTGTAELTNLAITLVGSHMSDFILGTTTINSLAPGASTSFSLIFRPTTSGTRNVTVRIASNDADENPFEINLNGNGVAVPEINVEKSNGNALIDASSSIQFTNVILGATSAAEVLTLRSSGTAALTNIAATISGSHAADFILEASPASSLTPGSSTTIKIFFKPTSSGTRTSVLRIASNDADENPFEINLNGNGIAVPEINVEKSNGNALTDAASSIQFTNVILGATSAAEVLTLRSSGTAALTNIAATISGSHAADFILEASPASSLTPGSSTTIKISFKPTSSGTRNAVLRIASNDADENPFEINLVGNGIPVPEIALFRADGSPISDGSNTFSFGSVSLGSVSAAETITIHNTGSAILSDLAVTVSGNSDADFVISALETTTLAPGASTSLAIAFHPQASGTRSAVLQLTSNDPNSSVSTVLLTGDGNAFPVLAVEQIDGTRLEPGSTLPDFGSVLVGTTSTPLALRIMNIGNAELSGLLVSSVGSNGSDFTVTQPTVTTLSPQAAALFSVTFKPGSDGNKSAVLRISSSDSSTPPYEVIVIGSAITTPSISLFDAEGSDLSAGAKTVNFGNLDILAAPKLRAFSIKNTGTAALTGVRILKEGPGASDFSIVANGLTSIAPGASADFSISFDSTSVGNRSAAIRILSNAGYDIVQPLTGKGLAAPEIKIEVADKNLRSGDSFINFGTTQISTRSETRTFTISNIGSANLEKISLVKNGTDPGDFIVTALKTNSLAPGKSTTFNVSFKPNETNVCWANVSISSNDMDEKPFVIGLTGRGTNRNDSAQSSARVSAAAKGEKPRAETGVEIIDGMKYRSLTIHQSTNAVVSSRDIEVSADLIHWSSGPRHTTVVRDHASVLTVRDNTPISQGAKRHIRLRP